MSGGWGVQGRQLLSVTWSRHGREGLACLDKRDPAHTTPISRRANGPKAHLVQVEAVVHGGHGELVCLDVRACRARDSISRRAHTWSRWKPWCTGDTAVAAADRAPPPRLPGPRAPSGASAAAQAEMERKTT